MLSWGNAKGPAAPSGAKGVFCLTSSPQPSMVCFPSQVPLSHFCQCISSWPATPVLHYSAENNTHTETGKLYFICQPCWTPEKPLELIPSAAFDSLLLRGWVKVLGHCRKGQGLWINVWAHQVVLEVTRSNYFIPVTCLFLSELSIGRDVIKVTWRGVGRHNGLSALAFVIHFVSRTCL